MVPLAQLMHQMLEIESALPIVSFFPMIAQIKRMEHMFSTHDSRMSAIHFKLQEYMDSAELSSRLSLFESDLFLKLEHLLDRLQNKFQLSLEDKASRSELKEDVKFKANYSELQIAQQRIVELQIILDGLMQSQEVGAMHLRDRVVKLEQKLLDTNDEIGHFAKAESMADLADKVRYLEEFMLENLASSMKMPMQESIDNDLNYFAQRKHMNLHGYGEEYLKLLNKKYADKEINQYPIKEKTSYLQVQSNEICEKIGAQQDQIANLADFTAHLQAKIDSHNDQMAGISQELRLMCDKQLQNQKDQQRMEQFFHNTSQEQKNLQDAHKRLEEGQMQARNEQRRLEDRIQRESEEFKHRLLKLEVTVDTHGREIELLKQTKRSLIEKIEQELILMKDLRFKTDRRGKETSDLVSLLQNQMGKLETGLQQQIDQLREPLAIEINQMRSENERLHTAFHRQKEDYRELTGGFLKVLESPRGGCDLPLRNDPFLNKQVMLKTFYSEATQRVTSPVEERGVPLPDIPKLFTKVNSHMQPRSYSTAGSYRSVLLDQQQFLIGKNATDTAKDTSQAAKGGKLMKFKHMMQQQSTTTPVVIDEEQHYASATTIGKGQGNNEKESGGQKQRLLRMVKGIGQQSASKRVLAIAAKPSKNRPLTEGSQPHR